MAKHKHMVPREYWSCDEAESYSGLSAWFWRRAAYAGRVESLKCGTRLLLPVAEVKRVLSESRRPRMVEAAEAVSA